MNPIMPGRVPFAQLTQYLSLTPQQIADLLRVNAEFQRFLTQKQTRASVVRREIVVETHRSHVDPMALGLRYMELEAICRESRDREVSIIRAARGLLLPVQVQRLAALEQAVAMLPLAGEAADARVLANEQGGGMALMMPQPRPLPGCMAPGAAARISATVRAADEDLDQDAVEQ